MSVNMSSLWELITEVTTHTEQLVDLVILGVVITVVFAVGAFIIGIVTGDATGTKEGGFRGSTGRSAYFMHKK